MCIKTNTVYPIPYSSKNKNSESEDSKQKIAHENNTNDKSIKDAEDKTSTDKKNKKRQEAKLKQEQKKQAKENKPQKCNIHNRVRKLDKEDNWYYNLLHTWNSTSLSKMSDAAKTMSIQSELKTKDNRLSKNITKFIENLNLNAINNEITIVVCDYDSTLNDSKYPMDLDQNICKPTKLGQFIFGDNNANLALETNNNTLRFVVSNRSKVWPDRLKDQGASDIFNFDIFKKSNKSKFSEVKDGMFGILRNSGHIKKIIPTTIVSMLLEQLSKVMNTKNIKFNILVLEDNPQHFKIIKDSLLNEFVLMDKVKVSWIVPKEFDPKSQTTKIKVYENKNTEKTSNISNKQIFNLFFDGSQNKDKAPISQYTTNNNILAESAHINRGPNNTVKDNVNVTKNKNNRNIGHADDVTIKTDITFIQFPGLTNINSMDNNSSPARKISIIQDTNRADKKFKNSTKV